MSRYKRKIEGLDPERGNDWYIFPDRLSVLHEMPIESANETICAYYRWLRGESEKEIKAEIKDPAAKIIFAVVVAAHKKRVKEYIDKCNKSIPNKHKRKNKRGKGKRGLTRVDHKEKDKFSEIGSLRSPISENADARKVAVADAGATAFADTAGRRDAPPWNEPNEMPKKILEALGEYE